VVVEDSVAVGLVEAVTLAVALVVVGVTSAAVLSMAARSAVAYPSQVELVPAEAASALAECAAKVVLRPLEARDPASLPLGIHRTQSTRWVALAHKVRVRRSQDSRISDFLTFVIMSSRGVMRTGTTTGTDGMFTLTMAASLCLSTGFGVD
jgi:hypothetical protein